MAKPGQSLRMVGIHGEHDIDGAALHRVECPLTIAERKRMLEMGFVPGAQIKLVRAGDPLILRVWGGRTAVSRSVADGIFVVPAAAAADWRSERAA
jgi:Fe2+ transport system protein FeoA